MCVGGCECVRGVASVWGGGCECVCIGVCVRVVGVRGVASVWGVGVSVYV